MQFSNRDCCIYNPLYPLYAKKTNKGLYISRIADDTRIATVVVRDISLLASCQWDQITGRHLTVFFKDGTARVHDVFQGGKLMSLLRICTKTVNGAVWDRIEIKASSNDESSLKFDCNVTKLMPKMIRFGRDTKQIFILPYEPPNGSWRLAIAEEDGVKLERQIVDVHLAHKENGDLVFMFDGDYVVRLPTSADEAPTSSSLQGMFAARNGFYYLIFQEGSVKSVNLGPLIENEPVVNLIKCFITMTQLGRYLQNHLELIRNDLIAPYNVFLEKICDRAFGYERLHEELVTLLLTGTISSELEDWLCNTINEKNSKKWRKLGLEMYQKGNQILTLAFLPAWERLILLSERCRGLLKAIQWVDNGITAETFYLEELTKSAQSILKLTLKTVQSVKSQEVLFQTFWHWFDDRVHEALDEDYKPKLQLYGQCKTGYEIATYLDLQIKETVQSQYANDLFKVDSFKVELDSFTEKLISARDHHLEPYVLQNSVVGHCSSILRNDGPQARLVGVAPLSQRSLTVCFISKVEDNSPSLSIRLLDKFTLDRVADDTLIQLPIGLDACQVERVSILENPHNQQNLAAPREPSSAQNTRLRFTMFIPHLAKNTNGTVTSQELCYQCEITADLFIVSLIMQGPPR